MIRLRRLPSLLLLTAAATAASVFITDSDLATSASAETPSAPATAEDSTPPAPATGATAPATGAEPPSIPAHSESHSVELTHSEDPSPTDMVTEIRQRREQLEAQAKALEAREAELKAREKALEDELKQLQAVRDDIGKIEGARKKEDDDRVNKIVETVETMSPKAAAPLLTGMDETLAVAAMAKIATPKLAKIMNVMDVKKCARLSELLAGVVRGRKPSSIPASHGAGETTRKSTKGGDSHDGQSEQQSVDGEPAGSGRGNAENGTERKGGVRKEG